MRGKDIRQSTLTGSDVKQDSLKGGDVDETTLGKVRAAAQADNAAQAANAAQANNANTVGGVPAEQLTIGRSGFDGTCDPGGALVKCATVTLGLPRAGPGPRHHRRPVAQRRCVGHVGPRRMPDPPQRRRPHLADGGGLDLPAHRQQPGAGALGSDGRHGPLPAGNHEFSLACEEDVGDMDFTDIRISAVLLGSG